MSERIYFTPSFEEPTTIPKGSVVNYDLEKGFYYTTKDNKTTLPEEKPLDRQVGGRHYKDFAIQPIEFVQRNGLNFCEGNIVKYICRHHNKGGKQDIDKVIHYAEMLKQMEYGE